MSVVAAFLNDYSEDAQQIKSEKLISSLSSITLHGLEHKESYLNSEVIQNRDSGIFEDFSPAYICDSDSPSSIEIGPNKDNFANINITDNSFDELSDSIDSNLSDLDEGSDTKEYTSETDISDYSLQYAEFESDNSLGEQKKNFSKNSLVEFSSSVEDGSGSEVSSELQDIVTSEYEAPCTVESVNSFTNEPINSTASDSQFSGIVENDFSSATEDNEVSGNQTDRKSCSAGGICCEDTSYKLKHSHSIQEDTPSDLENKIAKTEFKMSDAILSNGKEDLSYFTEKLRQLVRQHDPDDLDQPFAEEIKKKNYINNNEYLIESNPVDQNDMITKIKLQFDATPISSCQNHTIGTSENEFSDISQNIKDKIPEHVEVQHTSTYTSKKDSEVIKNVNTEKDTYTAKSTVSFSFNENYHRPRPSPQQRRKERTALRRSIAHNSNYAKELTSSDVGEFDVYAMETALPNIDWDTIEAHLEASNEEEKRRRTDREEIRRKLAMGTDDDFNTERTCKKPSLHSRLQNGTSLQICFMNETASDCDSQCSDTESTQDRIDEAELRTAVKDSNAAVGDCSEFSFHQARLQAEAKLALAQAKDMARMQMQIEKQSLNKSPISEIVRNSFNKIGFPFPDCKRRMSRQILTDMNVAQLQVIVNDMHTQIENLNEDLVRLLLERDDLHMGQDSMLVDIEDLTKHLGAKQETVIETTKFGKNTKTFVLKSPPINLQKKNTQK